MAYQTLPVRRARQFVPDEAREMASDLRSVARDTGDLRARLGVLGREIEAGWQGRAQARFLEGFQGQPGSADAAAAWVDMQARRLETTVVTAWETILEKVWIPDQ